MRSLASVLHRLTGLNTRILDPAGAVIEAADAVPIPGRWRIGEWEDADAALPATGTVALRMDANGLRYVLARPDASRLIVCGPFVGPDGRTRTPAGLPVGERELWAGFISSLPHKTRDDLDAIAELLASASHLGSTDLKRPLEPLAIPDAGPGEARGTRDEIDARYAAERRMRDAISRGDREGLDSLFDGSPSMGAFADRLPDDPLRLRKNLLIVLNSIGRLAAEKGGVQPLELHALSEKHAILIERCRTSAEAEALAQTILYAYCDAVRSHSVTSLSRPVRRAATHILRNLDEKLTLDLLARHAGCNPTYLSRRFRQETGLTITEYTTQKRVAAACWLLENDDLPVTEVAYRVGFEDPNYFSRVFRAQMGITAREYRRENLASRADGIPIG